MSVHLAMLNNAVFNQVSLQEQSPIREIGLDQLLATGLTPEAILYVAQMRMKDIDGQVSTAMKEISDINQESKKISEQIKALRELQDYAKSKNIGDWIGYGEVKTLGPGETERHKIPVEDSETKLTVEQFLKEHGLEGQLQVGYTKGNSSVKMDQIDGLVKRLEEQQSSINNGNEMRMIQLQTLMQQRTQILSLTTNLLKKMDESNQAIIRNLV